MLLKILLPSSSCVASVKVVDVPCGVEDPNPLVVSGVYDRVVDEVHGHRRTGREQEYPEHDCQRLKPSLEGEP